MWISLLTFVISLSPLLFSNAANFDCGVVKVKTYVQLSFNGTSSYAGQWPWLAPLFRFNDQYTCGSSIITQWHLLTAAHCIITEAKNYHALLGRFDLTNSTEMNWIRRDMREVYVHDDYNSTAATQRSNGDLAIFKVTEMIHYTDFIQPICLPEASINVVGIVGIVAGYGITESIGNIQNTPSYVKMKSIDAWICLGKSLIYGSIVSERSFCAVNEEAVPCQGDSGGGYYVRNQTTHQYVINGVVSFGIGHCDPREYVAFVDVSKYLPWIRKKIESQQFSLFTSAAIPHPCDNVECNEFAKCQIINGQPECLCLSQYSGSYPNCDSRCSRSQECPNNRACLYSVCTDLCLETSLCDENARCFMKNHRSKCECMDGYEGDGYSECITVSTEEKFINLCNNVDCINGECQIVNGKAECLCSSNFIGQYPDCKPKCFWNSQCPDSQACYNRKCTDLCLISPSCVENSRCIMRNHRAECECLEGYDGNGFVECLMVKKAKSDFIHDPCQFINCGDNSKCNVVNGNVKCVCLPKFTGIPPHCEPMCLTSSECPDNQACSQNTCKDLCLESKLCVANAQCTVKNHLMECNCMSGYEGNGLLQCLPSTHYIDGIVKIENICPYKPLGADLTALLNCINLSSFVFDITHAINSNTYEIRPTYRSEGVSGLVTHGNTKMLVHALPIKVAETFPYLTLFHAHLLSLREINPENFRNLKSLERLEILENKIELKVQKKSFDDLVALKYLDLSGNKINHLDSDLFQNLINLERLYLWFNQFTILPSSIFATLHKLEILKMSDNKLESFDENIFTNLAELRDLSLTNNELTTLPHNLIERNLKLVKVYLCQNKISYLHEEFFKNNRKLEKLFLDDNQLINLSSKLFENLTELSTLKLNKNKLASLPDDIFINLQKLDKLDLSGNFLSENLTALNFINHWRADVITDYNQNKNKLLLTFLPLGKSCSTCQ